MAAADESTTKYGTSNAWGVSQRIGGSCGSVFARTLVQNLSSASNPLFDPRERSQSLHSPITQPLLHAEEPDKSQTQTYNVFCHSSWEACEHRVTRLWNEQGFSSSAQGDEWDHSWTGRAGVPLADFKRRWEHSPPTPTPAQPTFVTSKTHTQTTLPSARLTPQALVVLKRLSTR